MIRWLRETESLPRWALLAFVFGWLSFVVDTVLGWMR